MSSGMIQWLAAAAREAAWLLDLRLVPRAVVPLLAVTPAPMATAALLFAGHCCPATSGLPPGPLLCLNI
jgi:hypothetical protein